MSRPLQVILILLIILLAVFVRVADISRLPAGFMDEEIVNLRISETVRSGSIGVFYNLNTSDFAGRESFFPLLLAVTTGLTGDGLVGFRILPLICGLMSVALMFVLAKRMFGFAAGLLAALLCTGGLYPVLLSRLVIPQALLFPLYIGAFVALVNGLHLRETIRPIPPKTSDFGALALCSAFSFYTHFTGLMLIPIITAFLLYLRRTRQPVSRYMIRGEIFAGLLALILCLPYLLSTIRVPELSGLGAYWGYRPENPLVLFTHLYEMFRSLANFGGMGAPGFLMILGLGGLLVFGAMTAVQNWREPRYMLPLLMTGGGILPALWTGRADYNLTIALPGAILLLTIGTLRVPELFIRNYARRMAVRKIAWLTPIVTVVTFAGLYSELFMRWPKDDDIYRQFHGYLGHLAIFLDTTKDDIPTLICTNQLTGTSEQPVSDPILMDFMLHRPDANLRFSVCDTAIVFADGGKRQRVAFSFDNSRETPIALKAWLNQMAYKPVEIDGLKNAAVNEIDNETALASALGKITLSLASWPPDTPDADIPVPLPVRMGDNLTFEGYSINDEGRVVKPGESVVITTYWRIDGKQRDDLRLFTHLLLDPGSAPAAQNDLLDVASNFLRPRDILIQTSVVQIPYPFPEGAYYLSVGAYHFNGNQRVLFFDGSDKIRGDRLFLGTIEIKG